MDRRDFLKRAAAAALGVTAGGTAAAQSIPLERRPAVTIEGHNPAEVERLMAAAKQDQQAALAAVPEGFTENEWRLVVGAYVGSSQLVDSALSLSGTTSPLLPTNPNAIDFNKVINGQNLRLAEFIMYVANEQICNKVAEAAIASGSEGALAAKIDGLATTSLVTRKMIAANDKGEYASAIRQQSSYIAFAIDGAPFANSLPGLVVRQITLAGNGSYKTQYLYPAPAAVALARMGHANDQGPNAFPGLSGLQDLDRGIESLQRTYVLASNLNFNSAAVGALTPPPSSIRIGRPR